jgi:hypothetical protein
VPYLAYGPYGASVEVLPRNLPNLLSLKRVKPLPACSGRHGKNSSCFRQRLPLGERTPFNPAHEKKLEFGLEEPDGAIVASKRNDP